MKNDTPFKYKKRQTVKLTDLFTEAISAIKSYPFNMDPVFLYNGRSAFYWIGKKLMHTGVDTILMPSYHCLAMITPFKFLGINVDYYKVFENLDVDFGHLEYLVDNNKNIKAIVAVHYFGFPQNISKFKEIVNKNNIILIEDCAHALFSRDANKDLGKYGDLSIFSLRKTLPVYEGGILLINNEKYRRIFKDIHEEGLPFRQSMKIWYRMLMQELLSVSDGSMDAPDFSEQFAKYKSSSISRWIANNSRKKTIEMARRTNYSIITEMLSGNRLLSPLFPNLPEGVVPWAYPCRDLKGVEFHSILRHSGIPCLTFGFDLDEKMENDIVYINPGKRIVLLPVHQGLKEEDVRNMVYDINKITANYY